MGKRKFTAIERLAIWESHEKRCWLCREPLSFLETTIDHFFPESLLNDDEKRKSILKEYGLSDEGFNINNFENWLPSHSNCNQTKGANPPKFIPGNVFVLDKLISKSAHVQKSLRKLLEKTKRDKIFGSIIIGIEQKTISYSDLIKFFEDKNEKVQVIPKDLILLSGGYWVYKEDIVREGLCTCEKETCFGSMEKVYCYFSPNLSTWVVNTGLYYKCYDELIDCPRCFGNHKRGHIGKQRVCGKPFVDQVLQTDKAC